MTEDLYGDGIGSVSLVESMGSDLTIVNAARVSFGVEKDEVNSRDKKLINYLVKNKHTSTLEHNVITFKFVVPLFVARQHMRHRTWSYNEISRRYTSENIQFYLPAEFKKQHKTDRQASDDNLVPNQGHNRYIFQAAYRTAWAAYNDLIKHGVSREQARMILPVNLYTEYYGTVNLNNLLKFIDLRLDSHAQWEIQQVASACLNIATGLWPEAVNAWNSRNVKKAE